MSDTPTMGGKRRIDQVLAEGFTAEVAELETDEVRRRRDLAREELEYLSFLRRLLQGRRDILRDEQDRRRTGGERQPVLERVVSALSEERRGGSRGGAPMLPVPDDEIAMARRRVERLVSNSELSDIDALTDEALDVAIPRLEEEEREVSDVRAKVIAVHDALQDQMKLRLRAELGKLAP